MLLAILILIYNIGVTMSRLAGSELSIGVELLYRAAFVCGVGWWLQKETRESDMQRLYCKGLLIQAAWPMIIPYYLYKSRGLRSLFPIAILIGSFILAQFIAVVAYVLFNFPGVR